MGMGSSKHVILPTATANSRRVPAQSQLSNICGRNELGVFKDQVSLNVDKDTQQVGETFFMLCIFFLNTCSQH